MPEDHRSPGTDVVDIAIAIEIEEIRPAAALKKNRLPANSAERSSGAIHAAGHQLLGAGESNTALFARHHSGLASDKTERAMTYQPQVIRAAKREIRIAGNATCPGS